MHIPVAVPSSAPIPEITQVTSTSLYLEWYPLDANKARGVITNYRVGYRKHGNEGTEHTELLPATTLSYNIAGSCTCA